MSDLKLFRIGSKGVSQLQGSSVALEKSLQTLMENNLETLLGVQFLASEYSTGPKHGGRIDTLGMDENGCPVIIEYKRTLNENVMNQGLYYLDWLLDHKAQFKLLVMERLGVEVAQDIDWTSCRLLCIAGDFKKYDQHAASQINRNIELIRYTRYGDEFLLLDLVNSTVVSDAVSTKKGPAKTTSRSNKSSKSSSGMASVEKVIAGLSGELLDVYDAFQTFLLSLGDDVRVKHTKIYVAFRRIKNFATARPISGRVLVWLKIDPDTVSLEEGFSRDVREIGHWGSGNLELSIDSLEDLERAKPLLLRSYGAN